MDFQKVSLLVFSQHQFFELRFPNFPIYVQVAEGFGDAHDWIFNESKVPIISIHQTPFHRIFASFISVVSVLENEVPKD